MARLMLNKKRMAADLSSGTNAEAVVVAAGSARLPGVLLVPARALGVILFADVSGSTGCSPSSLFIARALEGAGFASLVLNLLAASEAAVDAHTGWLRTDTALLASRIIAGQRWLATRPDTEDLPMGLFAAGSAAAVALAATRFEPPFGAIVCFPDESRLPESGLEDVHAPTLVIAGMSEPQLRAADRTLAALRCERELAVVPGASHRFEEPGALEAVADLSRRWFERHLTREWSAVSP